MRSAGTQLCVIGVFFSLFLIFFFFSFADFSPAAMNATRRLLVAAMHFFLRLASLLLPHLDAASIEKSVTDVFPKSTRNRRETSVGRHLR